MNLAIITARGGSKRIPRKNIKIFHGKPIIAYSIEAALRSKCFDEIMVSTDDAEIAKIAMEYGACVPFLRSSKNSGDFATTTDVILEVIQNYQNNKKIITNYGCIYPTAPFVTHKTLQEACALLEDRMCNAVVSVVPFSFSPYRSNTIDNSGYLSYKYPEYRDIRSQDLESLYHDAGQFYFGKADVIKIQKTLVPSYTKPFILSEIQVQDIDTETDWKIAELKYELFMRGV